MNLFVNILLPITHHPVLGVGGPGPGGGMLPGFWNFENPAIPTIHFLEIAKFENCESL